ncbi:MAG: DUF4956 domain-containing protein [Lachnospiraceae bacterium]|nr:DUF4956 domain-containing protein [Lachnospiraceae bacterium]
MGFSDVLKNSFVEATQDSISREGIMIALLITCLLSVYIFCIYRITTRKVFYNKSFNISLVALSLITTAIILSIQSSVVISLGMVGALSIVRFRTAIKEPMDLVFLFWSISVGIICGAGLFEIAIWASLLITIAIFVLDKLPAAKVPMILIVDSSDIDSEEAIMKVVEEYSAHSKIKSRNMNAESLNLVIEVKVKEAAECIREINKLEGMNNVSLVTQEGEVTYGQ